jgi:hypothetical protein
VCVSICVVCVVCVVCVGICVVCVCVCCVCMRISRTKADTHLTSSKLVPASKVGKNSKEGLTGTQPCIKHHLLDADACASRRRRMRIDAHTPIYAHTHLRVIFPI